MMEGCPNRRLNMNSMKVVSIYRLALSAKAGSRVETGSTRSVMLTSIIFRNEFTWYTFTCGPAAFARDPLRRRLQK